MLAFLTTAFLSYMGTTSDYFFVLLAIFANHTTVSSHRRIFIGELIGNAILIFFSLLLACVLKFVPDEWLLGLLGIFPILIGIKGLVVKESEAEKIKSSDTHLIRDVVVLTLTTCGADNLAIYIPLFANMNFFYLPAVLIMFLLLLSLVSLMALKITAISAVSQILNRYEGLFQLIIYSILGLYILLEAGTISHLLALF
ncbi:cadmium resistance transporter [Oenococcus sicerae]|uniref:cadmium resistance transporter n=1 Tax=Oenococcus sicerae TaxID=2203724 RepID=UPI0039E9B4EA